MKIVVLASGSGGNCTYIIGKNANIMIDAGITYKQIICRLKEVGIEELKANALLITHEHGDHIGKITSLLGKKDIKYYINTKSYLSLPPDIFHSVKNKPHELIESMQTIEIDGFVIEPFSLSHDTRECLGFKITEDNKTIAYVADTGYLNEEYRDMLKNCDAYFFEANHDPMMQYNSKRPECLKKRVLGDRGHLSNQDCAENLCYLITENTKNICFLHRSRDCNTLDILKETVFRVFDDFSIDTSKIKIDYAEQDITVVVEV